MLQNLRMYADIIRAYISRDVSKMAGTLCRACVSLCVVFALWVNCVSDWLPLSPIIPHFVPHCSLWARHVGWGCARLCRLAPWGCARLCRLAPWGCARLCRLAPWGCARLGRLAPPHSPRPPCASLALWLAPRGRGIWGGYCVTYCMPLQSSECISASNCAGHASSYHFAVFAPPLMYRCKIPSSTRNPR